MEKIEGPPPLQTRRELEPTEPETEDRKYEELALKIIREAGKLGRPLDVFDAPLLAALIKKSQSK